MWRQECGAKGQGYYGLPKEIAIQNSFTARPPKDTRKILLGEFEMKGTNGIKAQMKLLWF